MRSVFVSYRRGDSEGQARSLHFELVKLIGKESVFMDVDSIALGQDFRQILREHLESCDLMLALIGPGWLDAKDAAGNRRLESVTDLVRQEIAAALKRNILVTPVLLQGAQMPSPEQLPDDIKELVYRNGFELGHSTWESDVGEMVRRLGLDKQSPTPARTSMETDGKSPVSAVSGRFKASWAVAMVVVIAILAALLLYQRTRDQSSGDGIVASSQQPSGSSSQPPTEASSQPPSQTSPRPSAGPLPQPPVGFGVISLANLARAVEVCEQSSSGGYTIDAGYAGSISPPATTLQVPAGTYKLKFDKLFVQPIRVESGKTVNAQ